MNPALRGYGYTSKPHAVVTVDTLPFVKSLEDRIVLSPMNSGNTQSIAHPRGPAIFKKMRDYPFKERAKYGDDYQVGELAVRGCADVASTVLSVDLIQCYGNGLRILKNILKKE